jgi:regulator of replication initiation timing
LDKFDAENKRLEESVNKLNGLNETFQKTNAELKTNVDDLRSETENLHVQLGKMKDTISDLDTVRQAMEAFAKQNQLDLGEAMGNLKSAISEQKQLIKDQQLILNKVCVFLFGLFFMPSVHGWRGVLKEKFLFRKLNFLSFGFVDQRGCQDSRKINALAIAKPTSIF